MYLFPSAKSIVPHSRRADEVGIFSQRREHELRLLGWDESEAAGDDFANAVKKQRRAIHHATAEHNGVRRKQIDQVGESQAEIEGLMLDGSQSSFIPLLRKLTNLLRRDPLAMRISRRRMALDPRHHGRTSGQRFPAPVKSARALRPRRIDDLVANLRVSAVDPAVKLAIDNDSAANSGTDGHIDQPRAIPPRAPSRFGERRRVAVVFQRHTHIENLRQIFDQTLPAPARHKIDVANPAAHGIDWARGPDAMRGEFGDVDFMPGWRGKGLVKDLAQIFNVRVALENDGDAAALAEAGWGAGRNRSRLIYVTVGTGIGGGIIIDGQLYRGVDGAHPEVGHHVVDPAGPECSCGFHGCWESLAAGPAMVAWLESHAPAGYPHGEGITAKKICELAQQGDETALRAVEHEAFYLGLGLANLINLFTPDAIVLSGSVMNSAPLFLDRIREVIASGFRFVPAEKTQLMLASLGEDTNLIGAARVWHYRFGRGEQIHS